MHVAAPAASAGERRAAGDAAAVTEQPESGAGPAGGRFPARTTSGLVDNRLPGLRSGPARSVLLTFRWTYIRPLG
jgi:hypothetical protein